MQLLKLFNWQEKHQIKYKCIRRGKSFRINISPCLLLYCLFFCYILSCSIHISTNLLLVQLHVLLAFLCLFFTVSNWKIIHCNYIIQYDIVIIIVIIVDNKTLWNVTIHWKILIFHFECAVSFQLLPYFSFSFCIDISMQTSFFPRIACSICSTARRFYSLVNCFNLLLLWIVKN